MTLSSSKASEGAMRKLASASLLAVALIVVLAAPSLAGGGSHGHGSRVFVTVGPGFWWGGYPYPYYYYPYPYYPYPYYYTPPRVVVQEPPVYVQQEAAPAVPETSAPAEGYWHYCPSAREYYPTVATCPEAWIKVPPRQE
jgi:hypothetical protein